MIGAPWEVYRLLYEMAQLRLVRDLLLRDAETPDMRRAKRPTHVFRHLIAALPLSILAAAASCGGDVATSVDSTPPCPQKGAGFGCTNHCIAIPEGDTWPEDPDGGDTSSMHAQTCQHFCHSFTNPDCYLNPKDPSERTVVCISMCSGRRPSGFEGGVADCPANLGAFFSEMARLEAASVHAFRAPMRSLEAIAIESAVEGCVRETFGALLATYQVGNIRDPLLREAMARIARDETRHAALAWQVAGWLHGKLDVEARARVAEARRDAALELIRSPAGSHWGSAAALGLPDAEAMKQLATLARAALWS
jgi:hypothetical protein